MRRRLASISCLALSVALGAPALAAPQDGGTQVTVQVTDGGDTTVAVHQGQLEVRAGGEETRVPGGQGVQVKRGRRAKRLPLLPAPGDLAPKDGTRINTLSVTLTWNPVAGARSYQVRIERTGAPTSSKRIASELPTAALALEPGVYRWSVRAVGDAGLVGQRATRHTLTVDVTPPKLKAGKPKWR